MISAEQTVIRILVAAFLGGLIGVERERGNRAAGLRTHALVGAGSSLFMLVSAFGFADSSGPDGSLDPSRVASQVVSGIGFLGGGAIIFQRDTVKGLTTAASIWVVAAIGLAAGGGMYLAAALTTGLALVILAGLKPLEQLFNPQKQTRRMVVSAESAEAVLPAIREALRQAGATTKRISIQPGKAGTESISLLFDDIPAEQFRNARAALEMVPGVLKVGPSRTSRRSHEV